MQCNHSYAFQSHFRPSFCLARNSLGLEPSVRLVCSKWDLLDMWLLLMRVASPGCIGRCNLGLAFTDDFIYSELPVSSVQSLICVWLFAIPWTAARLAYLSITTPGAYSNSCPSSQWCHPTITSSVIPFSFCFWSFPVTGSLSMSRFFASSGQSIAVSDSASVLPMNIQDWFPLGWTGWNSLLSKGLSRVFSKTVVQKHQFTDAQLSL